MLNFIKTNDIDPLKEYELHLSYLPLGIYWPTREAYEFMVSDPKTMNGLDVEAEAITDIAKHLCDMFSPYAVNFPMTKLEITVALGAARNDFRQKSAAS